MAAHQRDHQDLTSHERTYDQPQRLALMAANPRPNCPQEWPGDDAANKVDAVGIHLGEELREMPSSAKLAGQDSGENGIKAS